MTISMVSILLIIIAVSMWFLLPSAFFGYVIGLMLGMLLLLSVVRKIGKKAYKSIIAEAVFRKITKYRSTTYVIQRRQEDSISITVNSDNVGDDYQHLLNILKQQMRFPPDKASEAAKYALDIAKDKPLQEKLRIALQSLDACSIQGNASQKT